MLRFVANRVDRIVFVLEIVTREGGGGGILSA